MWVMFVASGGVGSPQNADHADCRLCRPRRLCRLSTFFLTLDSLFSVLQSQNSVQYVLVFVIYPQPAHPQHLNVWPPFSLTRDFGKQNTRRNVSKIFVSLPCYRQIGSKSTNHSQSVTFRPGALTIWMEFSVISGRIQMERFIPVVRFRTKGNTFRGISFFLLLPKFPKISVTFVHSYSARLFTVIHPRKIYAKDLKDGDRFLKRLSLQCVSLLVGSVCGRFRAQLQPL